MGNHRTPRFFGSMLTRAVDAAQKSIGAYFGPLSPSLMGLWGFVFVHNPLIIHNLPNL